MRNRSLRYGLSALSVSLVLIVMVQGVGGAASGDGFNCVGCVDKLDVNRDAIGSSEIINGSVTKADLAPNSVGPSELRDRTIQINELAPSARSRVIYARDWSIWDTDESPATIGSFDLPKGNWLLTASVWYHNSSNAGFIMSCRLTVGDEHVESIDYVAPEVPGDADYRFTVLDHATDLQGARPVSFTCDSVGNDVRYLYPAIIATKVASVRHIGL